MEATTKIELAIGNTKRATRREERGERREKGNTIVIGGRSFPKKF